MISHDALYVEDVCIRDSAISVVLVYQKEEEFHIIQMSYLVNLASDFSPITFFSDV